MCSIAAWHVIFAVSSEPNMGLLHLFIVFRWNNELRDTAGTRGKRIS